MNNTQVTTLFKYIGGKGWLKEHLEKEINNLLVKSPKETYVEPFAGGLGSFIGIYNTLLNHNIRNVILNDINHKLVNFYHVVESMPERLIKKYFELENSYIKTIPQEAYTLHKTDNKEQLKILLTDSNQYFKNIRDLFNTKDNSPIVSAAYLLFLQKHCFNGVYRENSGGGYNTPYNWEPGTIEENKFINKILNLHHMFKKFNITFSTKSFEDLSYNKHSLYYIDPPYINEQNKNENKYNKNRFTADTQLKLIELISPCSFLYSNHDNEILINQFKKFNLQHCSIQRIPRKNIISSSAESRKNDKIEILISNFT